MKRTFQPSQKRRVRQFGFLARTRTKAGRAILARSAVCLAQPVDVDVMRQRRERPVRHLPRNHARYIQSREMASLPCFALPLRSSSLFNEFRKMQAAALSDKRLDDGIADLLCDSIWAVGLWHNAVLVHSGDERCWICVGTALVG